jgi:hypothetical protein
MGSKGKWERKSRANRRANRVFDDNILVPVAGPNLITFEGHARGGGCLGHYAGGGGQECESFNEPHCLCKTAAFAQMSESASTRLCDDRLHSLPPFMLVIDSPVIIFALSSIQGVLCINTDGER